MSKRKRGWNLRAGQQDGDRGRRMGGKVAGTELKDRPAPADCEHCKKWGYKTWHQHLAHLGLQAAAEAHGVTPREFLLNGVAMQDPFPENQYFQQWRIRLENQNDN